jgi:hypothetical protein
MEGGSLLVFHEKYINDGKVLDHLWLQSKVFPGPLTDLSSWVGFCSSSEKYIKDGKVLDHLGFQSKVFPGPLTDLSSWVGFCSSSPQQGVKYQL